VKRLIAFLIITGALLSGRTRVCAQEFPPRPISVYANPAQGLCFGAFYHGVIGGTVIVHPNGIRTTTGDVVPINMGFVISPAQFEIDANPGTLISVLGSTTTLAGSNGGSITLNIGGTSPASPFITTAIPPARTIVYVGGTLTVGNMLANPPGNYSGTFQVTFIQE